MICNKYEEWLRPLISALPTSRVLYTRVLQQPSKGSERAVLQALLSHSYCILRPYISYGQSGCKQLGSVLRNFAKELSEKEGISSIQMATTTKLNIDKATVRQLFKAVVKASDVPCCNSWKSRTNTGSQQWNAQSLHCLDLAKVQTQQGRLFFLILAV